MASNQNYGTAASTEPDGNTHDGTAHEGTSLLGNNKSTPSQLSVHLNQNVRKRRADLILLAGYIITGLLDAAAISIWGSFVSMQTGNTIYLGLGLAQPHEGTKWITSGISILAFCLGSLCFSAFHRYFSPRKRWVLLASYSFQLALVIAAGAIVDFADPGGDPIRWQVIVPLAMIAFQSSGQAVTSRALQFNSLTSVVLTSIYCDLFSDPKLLDGLAANPERNRRIAAPLLLLVGAIFGGLFARSSIGLPGAVWTAAILKAIIIVTWSVWPAEEETRTQSA